MNRRALLASIAGFAIAARVTAAPVGAIDRSGFVPIGGIDQWIGMRGDRADNPVLLVVHGGPGESQMMAAAQYQPWEAAFTVVQWDQRGAGRTYSRLGAQTPEVNLDRIARDGIEVAEHLCRTLGKRKIIVLGHSWGSTVAVTMVQRRPELFAACVGTGQVASWHASVQAQFDLLLAKARADNDTAAIKMLEAIGKPDPKNAAQYFGFTKTLFAIWAPSDQAWIKGLRAATPESRGITADDLKALGDGMNFSGEKVLPDQMAADLPATAAGLKVPFFVIQGRDDVITPTSAAVAYFDRVRAPAKALVLLDGAGHFAFMTHTGPFLAALVVKVRPMAIAHGA